MTTKLPTIQEVIQSPYYHNTLKRALMSFNEVDVVDAAHDAELLFLLMRAKADKALGVVS